MAIEVVGSQMAPKNGYGQNGFQGPSSDTPDRRTKIGGPLSPPDPDAATVAVARNFREDANWQTRTVTTDQKVPTKGTMRSRSGEGGTVPDANLRRPVVLADHRAFQR